MLGYLSQLDIKEQIINFLKNYKDEIISVVPGKIKMNKQIFYDRVLKHLNVLRTIIKSPDDYIKVYSECEDLEEQILTYASDLNEIERLQEIYLRIRKVELGSLVEEKNLLNELKIKLKNYKEMK